MRDIKFRGLDEENKCWRYGWYTRLQDGARKYAAIVCDEDGTLVRYYIHDKETVGQFTGLHDKNGKEIYEGDIVNLLNYYNTHEKVIFSKGAFTITGKFKFVPKLSEVIGNIHEKAKLLS